MTKQNSSYTQPYAPNTCGSEMFRIPSLLTLNNGSVIASVDLRYNHGSDSPHNLDCCCAISKDGYSGWEYTVLNEFDDYPAGQTGKDSASFIDPAVIQSKRTGRIFVLADCYPSGGGIVAAVKGNGFKDIHGKSRLLLTKGDRKKFESFEYYVGDFENGFAPVYKIEGDEKTEYTLDGEYRIYQGGEVLKTKQKLTDAEINQCVFYDDSVLKVLFTNYLVLRHSDDNGKTWSDYKIISKSVKQESETFFGASPGRGFVTEVGGKERIMFPCYRSHHYRERMIVVYSDDNGETWKRGKQTTYRPLIGKTSETQIVALPDGNLRAYSRNLISRVAYADSFDGGISWTKFKADLNFSCTKNCMLSFVNHSMKIGGKSTVLASCGSEERSRANGIVRVGVFEKDNSVTWLSEYYLNKGFFAYSCLGELPDGRVGCLSELECNGIIDYKILDLNSDGFLREIGGNDCENPYKNEKPPVEKKRREVIYRLLSAIGLL